jgi:hypothetical protein
MARFRDKLEADITRTFLNSEEFAEEHEIGDGNTSTVCLMVITEAGAAAVISGVEIRAGHIAVLLETKNAPENYSLGSSIYIDGRVYTVENEPVDAFGMIELQLKRLY